jgi:hypothetical protein
MRLSSRLLLFSAALLVAGVARATPARVVALGDMGEYVEDDTNVLLYPAEIAKWAHFVYIDIGGGSNGVQTGPFSTLSEIQVGGGPNAAAFVRLGDFQLGAITSDFVANEESIFLQSVAAHASTTFAGNGGPTGVFSQLASLNTLRRYDLILGYGSAKDFSAALRFSYGGFDQSYTAPAGAVLTDPDSGAKTTRTTDSQNLNQTRLQAGLFFNLGGGVSLDTTIDYTYFGASYLKNGIATFNNGAGNAIGLAARLRVPITRWWTLIPQFSYRGWFFNLEEKFTLPAYGPTDNTASDNLDKGAETLEHAMDQHYFDAGVAGELKASKFATFWIATGFTVAAMGISQTDVDLNMKTNTGFQSNVVERGLPYVKFAAELTPFDFWKLRIGAEKYMFEYTASQTNINNNAEAPVPVTTTTSVAGDVIGAAPGTIPSNLTQADFAVYVGTSFIVPYGFAFDFLVDNDILTGNFKGGFAGRASVSYKF